MNKTLRGLFLAIFIFVTVIALLGANLASAKDYSVTAGNWQVNFRSNDTLYNKAVESNNGIYTIWLNETQTRISAIQLFEFNNPTPFGKESMKGWMHLYFAKFNETPILSDYTIDGKDALIAEGWDAKLGSIVYGAMYPIDINSYGSAQKSVGFLSWLDRKTNFEILNSLHVEHAEYPQASQTPVTTNSGIAGPYVLIKCQGTTYPKIGYSHAEPGKVYLVTNLQIENHGYDEFSVNPNYVKIEINKVQYDYSWIGVGDLGLSSLDSATLKDGGIITGAVAFEVPSNTNQYALTWKTWSFLESYNVKVEYVT